MNGIGTYGISGVDRRPRGGGTNLLAIGAQDAQSGLGLIGDAAAQEVQRNSANAMAKQQAKAGGVQFGATAGALGSMALGFGPVGIGVAAVVGALAGSELF